MLLSPLKSSTTSESIDLPINEVSMLESKVRSIGVQIKFYGRPYLISIFVKRIEELERIRPIKIEFWGNIIANFNFISNHL